MAEDDEVSRAWLRQAVRECADEWMASGRIHVPPDDTSQDDDLAFWTAVDDRVAEMARRAGSESP